MSQPASISNARTCKTSAQFRIHTHTLFRPTAAQYTTHACNTHTDAHRKCKQEIKVAHKCLLVDQAGSSLQYRCFSIPPSVPTLTTAARCYAVLLTPPYSPPPPGVIGSPSLSRYGPAPPPPPPLSAHHLLCIPSVSISSRGDISCHLLPPALPPRTPRSSPNQLWARSLAAPVAAGEKLRRN